MTLSNWAFIGVFSDEDEAFEYDSKKYTLEENPSVNEIVQIEHLHLHKTLEKFWLASIHMKCQINIWEVYIPMEANLK